MSTQTTTRQQTDIVAVMAAHGIALTGSGAELKGRCPFHEDDTPSLSVNRDKGLWHCFGCGAKGNVRGFLRRVGGGAGAAGTRSTVGMIAVHDLAREAGRPRTNGPRLPEFPAGLHRGEVLGRVVGHYQRSLSTSRAAREYLEGRRLFDAEALRAFHVGFADGSLVSLAPEKSEMRAALLALGLLKQSARNPRAVWEHFKGCVVCPVEDPGNGAVAEIYGRAIAGRKHLYMNGRHAGIWNHPAIRAAEGGEVVIVESILDALACWMRGVRNVVPLYGTGGLTPHHVALFQKHRPCRFVLLMDADEGGRKAIPKLAESLSEISDVYTAGLPEGEDPASFFEKNHTAEELRGILAAARPVIASAEAETAPVLSGVEGPVLNIAEVTEIATETQSRIEKDSAALTIRRSDREYRVYDLNVYGVSKLRVNVHAVRGNRLHIDTLDLFTASPRKAFVNAAARELELSVEDVGADVAEVIRACQTVRSEAQKGKSEAKTETALSDEARAAAIEMLTAPDLLDRIVADMTALGYVGEETNKAVGYLVGVSRKLDEPMSAIVLSRSGAGKSQLLAAVSTLTAPEELDHFSNLTQNALYYMDKCELVHKLLIIEEREGSSAADYSIRELQSRKILSKAVPVKDPATGEMRTKRIEVHGPIAFLESTTNLRINPENASRCFILYADESQEQTERVQKAQRARSGFSKIEAYGVSDEIIARHHAAQRLLDPVVVVNPLAEVIDFPADQLRTRRDHARFLSLIEAVTFLHQHQRERKSRIVRGRTVEYIESTLDDYKAAYKLSKVVLAASLDELPRGSRQLLAAVIEYVRENGGEEAYFTRREIREATGWSVDQVKAYIWPLEEHEYLAVDRGKRGSVWRYRLARGDEKAGKGGANLAAIPAPAEIARRLGACRTGERAGRTGESAK